MYKRILVPLDGSSFSAQALPYARVIGDSFGSEIELFQATEPLDGLVRNWAFAGYDAPTAAFLGNGVRPPLEQFQDVQKHLRTEAMEGLQPYAARLRAIDLPVHLEVRDGRPAEAIADEADKELETLVIMATHSRFGIFQWWQGGVAHRVMRLSRAPLLAIPTRGQGPLRTVALIRKLILPLDGSPLAEQAVPHAVALAKALHARLQVLHAESAGVAASNVLAQAHDSSAEHPVPFNAEEYIRTMAERLLAEGVEDVDSAIIRTDPADAIIQAAMTGPDTLVAMATHGRSGISRLLLGSVADHVVQQGPAPVLLIRPQTTGDASDQAAA